MFKKILFLLFFFYILTLLQVSFFVHFGILGIIPNFVLIAVVLINFFAKEEKCGFFAGILGGFYLDVFSAGGTAFFGFYTLISTSLALFIGIFLKNYVRFPIFKRF